MNRPNSWTISIVSHQHGCRIADLLNHIVCLMAERDFKIVLTLNIPENEAWLATLPHALSDKLTVVRNRSPKGFGANHNQAIAQSEGQYVWLMDPELLIHKPVLNDVEQALQIETVAFASPQALYPSGRLQDNGRPIFSPLDLVKRYAAGRSRYNFTEPHESQNVYPIDWLAGLSMAARRETFDRLGGFDINYFMYCEDVDLCLRASQLGYINVLLPHVHIEHPPRRATFRDFRHLWWHVQSLIRMWRSPAYRYVRQRKADLQTQNHTSRKR